MIFLTSTLREIGEMMKAEYTRYVYICIYTPHTYMYTYTYTYIDICLALFLVHKLYTYTHITIALPLIFQ